jgi:LysM repeat protein
MKMPTIIKRRKLQAATARRSRGLGLAEGVNYEQMAEPNMKLSRALLIVLVLHIVAVAGIVAFNTIKTRETIATSPTEAVLAAATPAALPQSDADPALTQPNESTKVTATSERKMPEKESAAPGKVIMKTPAVPDSGKIHTVMKGENPVTIARHLHVSYDALLELNGITDPRKLQIGQKLHIPAASTATKHKAD